MAYPEPAPTAEEEEEAYEQTFSLYGHHDQEPTHWKAALFGSSLVYVLIAAAALTIGTAARQIMQEKEVEVKFVEEVVKVDPPPPPPPPPKVLKQAPPAAAPIVPKDIQVHQLDTPPPAKELLAPQDMPLDKPAEADPSLDKGIGVYGEGIGDVAGLEGGIAGGEAGGIAGLMRIPEDAAPPVPSKSNRPPVYPEVARKAKQVDTVVLRILVLSTGEVTEITVMSGSEPFASTAAAAVKKWRYRPATFEGKPVSTFRIIRIPFKLTA